MTTDRKHWEIVEQVGLPDTLRIELRKPLSLGDLTWTYLDLREPTAAEWEQFDKVGGVTADITAIAIISGVPRPAVAMLGARDLRAAGKYIAAFLFDAPPTGEGD